MLFFVLLQLWELYRQELLRRLGREPQHKLFPISELRKAVVHAENVRVQSLKEDQRIKGLNIKEGLGSGDTVFITDAQDAAREIQRLEKEIVMAKRQTFRIVLPEMAIDAMRILPTVGLVFYALAVHGAWWGTPAPISPGVHP